MPDTNRYFVVDRRTLYDNDYHLQKNSFEVVKKISNCLRASKNAYNRDLVLAQIYWANTKAVRRRTQLSGELRIPRGKIFGRPLQFA